MAAASAKTSIALAALALLAAVGCGPASELEDGHYTHRGMHFALDVPEGWALHDARGVLIVELQGPAVMERLRPTVHVFSRREPREVNLKATVKELSDLMIDELRFDPGRAAEVKGAPPVVTEATFVSGIPAERVVRVVHEGATVMHQELIVAAKGDQAWALMISIPDPVVESSSAAVRQIKETFRVW